MRCARRRCRCDEPREPGRRGKEPASTGGGEAATGWPPAARSCPLRLTRRRAAIAAADIGRSRGRHHTRAAVLRESLRYFIARESARVQRTRHYEAIAAISRVESWDPITNCLAGREASPP